MDRLPSPSNRLCSKEARSRSLGLVGAARLGLVAVMFASLAGSAGCTYAHDRLKDTVDIMGIKLIGGPGAKLGIGFGSAKTGLNIGYYRFEKFGFQGRAMGVWEETGLEILAPADHNLEAVWGNKELFDMVAEFKAIDGYPSRAALFDQELTYPRRRFHVPDGFHFGDPAPGVFSALTPTGLLALGDLQFTAALFGGLEINFSFYQLADWFLGWFYIDIAKDDTRNYEPVGPREDD